MAIGRYEHLVGHLSYAYKSKAMLSREVTIGITVGCSLQVIILSIIILACCVYCRQNKNKKANGAQRTDPELDLVHMPSL